MSILHPRPKGSKHAIGAPVPAERPPLCPEHTMPIPGLVLPTEIPPYSRSARPRHARPVAPMNYEPIPLPRPYVPHPASPLTAPAARVAITQPALFARQDPRFATICSVQCPCKRSTSHGGTGTFADLYAAARLDGWRQDLFGTWTCPACQQRPGYWPANVVTVRDEVHEYSLIQRVSRIAGTPDGFVTALRSAA